MAREPDSRPDSSDRNGSRNAADSSAGSGKAVPQAAIAAGVALLVVGLCLITFAVVKPGSDKTDSINLTAGAPVVAPTTAAVTVTATPTPSATASKKETPKPKPKVTEKATTPAPKPTPTKKKAAPRAKPLAGKAYKLRNVITGHCASTMVFGVATTQEDCAAQKSVQLEPTRAVDGVQLYRVRDGGGADLCLDVPERESAAAGSGVMAIECVNPSTQDNQEFRLQDTGKTSKARAVYLVVNFKSGNCLDVLGGAADKGDRATGMALTIATCETSAEGFDDRLWTFS